MPLDIVGLGAGALFSDVLGGDAASTIGGDMLAGTAGDLTSGATLGATGAGPGFFDGINVPWGTLAQLGAGGLAAGSQAATNAANAALAQKQMDFQERMSDTAYQRETKDMIAAGINPMLATKMGGASTPPGSIATMQNPASAGIAAYSSAAQVDNVRKQNELIGAQIDKTHADTVQSYSSAGQLDAQRDATRQEMGSFERRMQKLGWETKSAEFTAGINNSEDFIRAQQKDLGIARAEVLRIMNQASEYEQRAKLLGLEVPEGIAQAAYWNRFGEAGVIAEKAAGVVSKFNPLAKTLSTAAGALK